ncbi:hypothetical protein [Streptococcus anginosus]|nr:hypothetical protein [Streptococcus anginosus]
MSSNKCLTDKEIMDDYKTKQEFIQNLLETLQTEVGFVKEWED